MKNNKHNELLAEAADLREKLDEALDTLNAIRNGEMDSLVVSAPEGEKIYTLKGADYTSRILLEQMQEGALIIDSEFLIIYANRFMEQMLKCSLEKITGKYLYGFFPPEDRTVLESYKKRSMTLNIRDELRMLAGDGREIPVLLSTTMVQLDGEEFYFIIATDLTEQKSNEEERVRTYKKVEQVYNAISAGICVMDNDGRITNVNDSFLRMFNFDKMHLFGKIFNEVMKTDISITGEFPIDTLTSGSGIINHEFSRTGKDGKEQVFSMRSVPLVDTNGQVAGIIINCDDITERRDLEKKFRGLMEVERQNLSTDLHDSLAQKLSAVSFQLESIRMKLEKTPHYPDEAFNSAMGLIQTTIGEARGIARGICPVENTPEGFIEALRENARMVRKNSGVNCSINMNRNIVFHDTNRANYLYNIVHECINYSIYNMHTKKIALDFIVTGGRLSVSISVDGTGALTPDDKSQVIDLELMKYRVNVIGGTFEIKHKVKSTSQILISQIPLA